jgi:hypothetical protein
MKKVRKFIFCHNKKFLPLSSKNSQKGSKKHNNNINVLEYFAPFLELIKYSQTVGPITNQALGTIEKFLNMGFVCKCF